MQTEPRGTPARHQYTAAALTAAAQGLEYLLLYEPITAASGELVIRVDVDPGLARRDAPGPPVRPAPAPRPTADVARRKPATVVRHEPTRRMLTGSYIDPATTPPATTPPPPRFRLERRHKIGILALAVFAVLSGCAFGAVRFIDALATSAGSAVGAALPALLVIGAVIGAILLAVCTRAGRRVVRVFVEVKG